MLPRPVTAWVLETETQVLQPVQQAFYPLHLCSPCFKNIFLLKNIYIYNLGYCDGLSRNGPQSLVIKKWHYLTRIKGRGFVGGSVRVGFAQIRPSVSLLLLPRDVELQAPSPAPCRSVYHHTPCHEDNGQTSETVRSYN